MARITTPREGSRADPWPPPARRLAQIRAAHAALPVPGYAGRSIRPVSG
jgi:hypothetical protein